jgi:hypothetical protein
MAEITIRRCQVRVVRRGGWSWGPDPKNLADRVVRAIPALIREHLSRLGDIGEDIDILAPVRVTLRLRQAEFLDAIQGSPTGPIPVHPALRARFTQALDLAIAPHLEGRTAVSPTSENSPARHHDRTDPVPDLDFPGAAVRALLAWQAQGKLGLRLRWFSREALIAWQQSLRGRTSTRLGSDQEAEETRSDEVAAFFEEVQRRVIELGPIGPSLVDRLRRRLVVAVTLIEARKLAPDDPELWAALDRFVPLIAEPAQAHGPSPASGDHRPIAGKDAGRELPAAAEARDETGPSPAANLERAPGVAPSGRRGPRSTSPAGPQASLPGAAPVREGRHRVSERIVATARGEVRVGCAIPFLMLGPLGQVGFLDTLRATFEAADQLELLPAFATALAYKALPPPERGWRRTIDHRGTAAAFAGLDEPLADPELHELERHAEALCSPLDAAVAQSLLDGHSAGDPLLIWKDVSNGGWLLVDVPGAFAVTWAETFAGLCERLTQVESECFLIPALSADQTVLREAHERGLRFVTDAPPARGESWRRVQHGARSWWTNDLATPRGALIRHAERLEDSESTVRSAWQALALDRRSLPLSSERVWERSLAMAAGLSLSQIAWTLWRDREATSPLLALERFGTLDALIRFEEKSIRVVLPLGARSLDLGSKRLLDDVPGVPWLGGRTVTFGKG